MLADCISLYSPLILTILFLYVMKINFIKSTTTPTMCLNYKRFTCVGFLYGVYTSFSFLYIIINLATSYNINSKVKNLLKNFFFIKWIINVINRFKESLTYLNAFIICNTY